MVLAVFCSHVRHHHIRGSRSTPLSAVTAPTQRADRSAVPRHTPNTWPLNRTQKPGDTICVHKCRDLQLRQLYCVATRPRNRETSIKRIALDGPSREIDRHIGRAGRRRIEVDTYGCRPSARLPRAGTGFAAPGRHPQSCRHQSSGEGDSRGDCHRDRIASPRRDSPTRKRAATQQISRFGHRVRAPENDGGSR